VRKYIVLLPFTIKNDPEMLIHHEIAEILLKLMLITNQSIGAKFSPSLF